MRRHVAALLLAITGVAAANTLPPGYSGHGGMTAHAIDPAVYLYHYDHGFTGDDAMGWDPQLQFAWSRVAAAKACAVPNLAQAQIVAALVERFGQAAVIHEIVGVSFHEAQIRGVPDFCSQARVAQLAALMPAFMQGMFELPAQDAPIAGDQTADATPTP